ncbi:MAG: TetR/AcrR family transcriptional regulator [Aromatoleum sp.]|jgi:AcrR family transcriptional regulator|uniref:TetR/AcrR family transcriptional regulator n=1 Tax=Aromatoleum sp. TaxID=2307007 RepID=UPI0028940CE9|nr:TetR/AcrR family transcriptional regulator [Aromatoleum sp.]MDT3672631.1 TetR/AcrR family transcriptional regulator [Aromatoleum sp.]
MSLADSDRLEARRQQVLDAAAECFHKSGFHGASMAQIAKTAGISPGHIYNLFENKEDVIGMIVEREQAELLAKVDAMQRADDVVQAMLDQVACGVESQLAGSDTALRMEILAEAGRNPKLAMVVRNADVQGREKLGSLLGAALAQRNLYREPEEVQARVEVLMALFDGLMLRSLRNPTIDRETVAPVVARVVAMLIDRQVPGNDEPA